MKEEKTEHSSKHNPEESNTYSKVSSITFELLSLNLIIIGGGYYLNNLVDTKIPWLLILSIFLSVAATIYYLLNKFKE